MASTAELELLVKARDEASGVLGAVSKKAGGLANVAGKALRTGAIAGGIAVAGLGIAALKMGLDFEKSMAEVRTLLPDISEEGFGELKQGVLDLSKELGLATDEAVPALYQAISAGVPPDNVLDFMKTAGKAAVAGVTDVETAVDGITSVMNAYGEEALSAAGTSDVMFTAVRLGKTNFEELSASLFNVIPTAASLGISFEEVAGSLAAMTAQGVPTSVATTQLRQLMVEASKGGSKLDLALRDLRGKGLAGLIEGGEDATHIMQDLRERLPEEEFRDLFGSVEAMNAALALTGPNAKGVSDAISEARDSAGATDEAFGVMAETASFKLNKAINLLKVTLTEVGVKILPLLTKALDKALPFLEENLPKAIEAIEDTIVDLRPHVERFIGTFTVGLRTIRTALEPLFSFIINNKPVLIAAIAAIAIAILLAFGPVAITVAAIIGFIALVGLIRQNWDELKAVFEDVEAFVTNIPVLGDLVKAAAAVVKDKVDAIIEIFKGLKALIEEVVTFVTAIFEGDWDQAWASAKEIAKIALNLLIDFIRVTFLGTIFTLMKELGPKILAGIGDLAGLLVQKGKDLLDGFIGGIKTVWEREKAFFSNLPGKIKNLLGSLFSTLFNKGFDLINGFLNGLKSAWFSVAEWIREKVDWVKDQFTSGFGLFSPSRVFRGYGEDMMKGLQMGLEGQAVKVNATVGNVTGGIASGTATGSAAGFARADGRSIHLTVNFHGPVFGLLDLDNHITQVVRDAVQGGAFRGIITTVGE